MSGKPQAHCLSYLSLKLATARKTSQRATGEITYRVLCDEQRERIFLTIVSNDGGGYFSKEILPFDGVERCLATFVDGKPLPAKALRDAFVGKSVNNAGFLAAILVAEGLLSGVPDMTHQYQLVGNWSDWKEAMVCADGTPYVPPTKSEVNDKSETRESDKADTTISANTHEVDGATEGCAEPVKRNGRGRKARPVGVPHIQEDNDACTTRP